MDRTELFDRFQGEMAKAIVGRVDIVRMLLVSLLAEGHVLLEGKPGLGKTTLAKAFAQSIGGEFKRIQMTPDTLPADILGTYVYDQRNSLFELHRGPIFSNVVLVDELNRATPKAQAAMLEAMQERQVSFEGETTKLFEPFIVLATQVAFGSPGTYPLSEVQSDRFAYSVPMDYPKLDEEISILTRIDEIESSSCNRVSSLKEILAIITTVKNVFVADQIKEYVVSLSNHLRKSQLLKVGPSPRASISIHKGARAVAYLDGRDHVIPDDVKFIAPYVLSHRLVLTSEAISEEQSVSQIVTSALETVPVPKE